MLRSLRHAARRELTDEDLGAMRETEKYHSEEDHILLWIVERCGKLTEGENI